MKKSILFITFIVFLANLNAIANDNFKNEIKKYDDLFKQIGEKRVGASNKRIDSIKNPFILVYKKNISLDGNTTLKSRIIYTLNAIFNNKAKINGKWYKLNSNVNDYKLVKISSKSVIIKNEHSKKELFIRKSDVSQIKFSSK